MLVRARVVSFLSGFAVAGCIALYQLRQDIWESHKLLASQVRVSLRGSSPWPFDLFRVLGGAEPPEVVFDVIFDRASAWHYLFSPSSRPLPCQLLC